MSLHNEDTGQTPDQVQVARDIWLEHENTVTRAGLISAFAQSRFLVPLVANKNVDISEMVQVTFQSNDGRKACLAFTSVEDLQKFDENARPLIKLASALALETLEQNLDGIIVDIASEHRIALTLREIASIAQG